MEHQYFPHACAAAQQAQSKFREEMHIGLGGWLQKKARKDVMEYAM